MVKSAFARHQANRLVKKYQKEVRQSHYDSMLEQVGFGSNFKKDPWDCGNPQCFVCHHDAKGKSNPVKVRKEKLTADELIEEAREKLRAMRDYQEAWQELGVNRVYEYYDDVDGNWLEEF